MQVNFAQHVKSLVEGMEEMGNPFLVESTDLLRLDTRDILDAAVASSVCQLGSRSMEETRLLAVQVIH